MQRLFLGFRFWLHGFKWSTVHMKPLVLCKIPAWLSMKMNYDPDRLKPISPLVDQAWHILAGRIPLGAQDVSRTQKSATYN